MLNESQFKEKFPHLAWLIGEECKDQGFTAKFVRMTEEVAPPPNDDVLLVEVWYEVGDPEGKHLWVTGCGSPDDDAYIDEFYLVDINN